MVTLITFFRPAQIGKRLPALDQEAARHVAAIVSGAGLAGDEQQLAKANALRQQKGFVGIGLCGDTVQHGFISFIHPRRESRSRHG
jgi:hypothetical protein